MICRWVFFRRQWVVRPQKDKHSWWASGEEGRCLMSLKVSSNLYGTVNCVPVCSINVFLEMTLKSRPPPSSRTAPLSPWQKSLPQDWMLLPTPPAWFLPSATSLVAQRLKHLPPMRETQVRSLGREDSLEKEMVTHSGILAWKIPRIEKPGRLQSMGSQSRTWPSDFTHFTC